MRLDSVITIFHTQTSFDEYGGETELTTLTEDIRATVSTGSNDLKPLPSGLGFYRTVTIIVDNEAGIGVGSVIQHNGTNFQLVRQIPYKANHFKCFAGHEV